MADNVIDSVTVASEFDPAGFERGMATLQSSIDDLAGDLAKQLREIPTPTFDTAALQQQIQPLTDSLHGLVTEAQLIAETPLGIQDLGAFVNDVNDASARVETLGRTLTEVGRAHPELHIDTSQLQTLAENLDALKDRVTSGLAETMQATGASAEDLAAGLTEVAGVDPSNIDELTGKLQELADQTGALTAAANAQSEAGDNTVQGLEGEAVAAEDVARAMSNAKRSTDEHAHAMGEHVEGATELRRSFREITAGVTEFAAVEGGASASAGELAGAVASLATASAPLAIAAATIAAVGAAFHILTRESRELEEQHRKTLDTLHERVSAPDFGPSEQELQANERMLELSKQLIDVRARLKEAEEGATVPLTGIGDALQAILLQRRLASTVRERAALEEDVFRSHMARIAEQAVAEAELDAGQLERETRLQALGATTAALEADRVLRLQQLRDEVVRLNAELADPAGAHRPGVGNEQRNRDTAQLLADTEKIDAIETHRLAVESQMVQFGLADSAARRAASAELTRQIRLSQDAAAGPEAQVRAYQRAVTLLDALNAATARQGQLLEQQTSQSLAAAQRLQTQAQGLGVNLTVRLETADSIDKLHELRSQIDGVVQADQARLAGLARFPGQFAAVAAEVQQLTGQRQQLDDFFRSINPTPLEEATRAIGPLGDRLTALRAIYPPLVASQEAAAGATTALIENYAELAAAVAAQGGPLSADVRLLQAQAQVIQQIGDQTGPYTAGLVEAASALERLRDAQAAAATAPTPDLQLIATLSLETARAEAQARAFKARIEASDALHLTAKIDAGFEGAAGQVASTLAQMDRIATALDPHYAKFKRDLEDTRSPAQRVSDSIHDVVEGLQGVSQRAGALAGIGQEAEQSIEQVLGLVDALAKVTASATTGNVFGAIFAGLGTLGAAFGGQDQEAEELKRLSAENTSALHDATAAYRAASTGLFQGLGGLADALSVVEQVLATPAGGFAADLPRSGFLTAEGTSALNAALAEVGISLEDFNQIAKDNGIKLLDEEGHLVGGALDDLREKLTEAAQNAEGFARTLADQTLQATLESRLTGTPQDPSEIFREQLQGLRGAGAGAIADLFTDPTNVAAVRQQALNLLHQFEAGVLPIGELGALTADEFKQFLSQSADYLDSFNTSVSDATKSLSNVPDIFNEAAAAFTFSEVPIPPPVPAPNIDPRTANLPPVIVPDLDRAALAASDLSDSLTTTSEATRLSLTEFAEALSGVSGGAAAQMADVLSGANDGLAEFKVMLDALTAAEPGRAGASDTRATDTRAAAGGPVVHVTVTGDIVVQGVSDPREAARLIRAEFEFDNDARFGTLGPVDTRGGF